MPIYEYRCQSCGHELEALQKISDPLLTECPACKAEALKKKVSAAGFRLKGGGWYETDFKSGNKKNVAGEKPGDESKDKGKDQAGGEKSADSGGGRDSSKGSGKSDSGKRDSGKSETKSAAGAKDSASKGASKQ